MHAYTEKLIARGAIKLPVYKQNRRTRDDIIAQAVDAAEDAAVATARATVEIATRQPDSLSKGLTVIVGALTQLVEENASRAGENAVRNLVESILLRDLDERVKDLVDFDELVEARVKEAIDDVMSEADIERQIERQVESAVEDALESNNDSDRLDDLERDVGELTDLKDSVEHTEGRVADLDDCIAKLGGELENDVKFSVKTLEARVMELAVTVEALAANANKPKGRLARWLGL